jgi:RNA polymerase sigma factor (TIGR02999 family)
MKITEGDLDKLFSELRVLARGVLSMNAQAGRRSLCPTELVLTALRRVRGVAREWHDVSWEDRGHFFAHVHQAMRSALIDHARRRRAQKRPQLVAVDPANLDFTNLPGLADELPERVVALDEALFWLEARDPELVMLIHHHYFTGETTEEIALVLAQPARTVRRRLAEARMLLHRKIVELLAGGKATSR